MVKFPTELDIHSTILDPDTRYHYAGQSTCLPVDKYFLISFLPQEPGQLECLHPTKTLEIARMKRKCFDAQ